jgi:hypothetical protein
VFRLWTLWGKAIDKFFEAGLEVSQGQGGLQMCEKLAVLGGSSHLVSGL